MIEIVIPWPPGILSANARPNRYEKAEAVRTARAGGLFAARKAGAHLVELPPGRVGAVILFNFPDDRHRDADNLLSRCKPVLDGICDALELDDSRLWPVTLDRGQNVKGGQVVIKIGA